MPAMLTQTTGWRRGIDVRPEALPAVSSVRQPGLAPEVQVDRRATGDLWLGLGLPGASLLVRLWIYHNLATDGPEPALVPAGGAVVAALIPAGNVGAALAPYLAAREVFAAHNRTNLLQRLQPPTHRSLRPGGLVIADFVLRGEEGGPTSATGWSVPRAPTCSTPAASTSRSTAPQARRCWPSRSTIVPRKIGLACSICWRSTTSDAGWEPVLRSGSATRS